MRCKDPVVEEAVVWCVLCVVVGSLLFSASSLCSEQFVVVVVVVELLWVQEVELVLVVAPPSCPGKLLGKLPLSPLPRNQLESLDE